MLACLLRYSRERAHLILINFSSLQLILTEHSHPRSLMRTATRSHNLYDAYVSGELFRKHTSKEVKWYTRNILCRKLRHEYPDRSKPFLFRVDGGNPFNSKTTVECYENNNIERVTGLPARSGDYFPIENLNRLIKKLVNEDLARKWPNGLRRTKANYARFFNFTQKSIKKHTRNTKELKGKVRGFINSMIKRQQKMIQSRGGPINY